MASKKTKKRTDASRSGPSGRSRTRREHLALGRIKVEVWLEKDEAALLSKLEAEDPGPGARSRALRRAIRELAAKK